MWLPPQGLLGTNSNKEVCVGRVRHHSGEKEGRHHQEPNSEREIAWLDGVSADLARRPDESLPKESGIKKSSNPRNTPVI